MGHYNIDGLVQDCSNSIADTLELLQSCTKPSIHDNLFGLTNTWNVDHTQVTVPILDCWRTVVETIKIFSDGKHSDKDLQLWCEAFRMRDLHLWLEAVIPIIVALRYDAGIILWMRPANERWRYTVPSSFIGWAHTQTDPWWWLLSRYATAESS